jgi:hypothetical protein
MPPFIVLADGPHLYEVPVVSYFNPLCVHQSSSLYIRVTYLILQERDVSTLHFAVTMQNSLIISDFLLHVCLSVGVGDIQQIRPMFVFICNNNVPRTNIIPSRNSFNFSFVFSCPLSSLSKIRGIPKSVTIEIFGCQKHAIKCLVPLKVTVNNIVMYYKLCNIPTSPSSFTRVIVSPVSFVGFLSTKKNFFSLLKCLCR